MKVIVLGNIGVGKSTILNSLSVYYPEAVKIQIDDFRRLYGNGSYEKEQKCKAIFLKSISIDDSLQFIELTGIGELGIDVIEKLRGCKCHVLLVCLYASKEIIFERLKKRKWDIPFPYGLEKVEGTVNKIQDSFEAGLFMSFFKKIDNSHFICLHNSIDKSIEENTNLIISFVDCLTGRP
jgi:deoxyadenosine/deoxycytidine kinase